MQASSATRIQRLSEQLALRDWDVFLAWSPVAMGYLHGFFEGSHERFSSLFVAKDGRLGMIAPELSATQAERAGIPNRRHWNDGMNPYALLQQLASEWGFASGVVALDMEMPAHMVLGVQGALPAAKFVIGEPALAELRRVKAPDELELMHRAGAIADAAFEAVKSFIRPGITEIQLQNQLFAEMERLGGKPTFCCAAFGPGSAEPHHITDETVLGANEIVLMDFGCEVERYQSDITRVVCCGAATEDMRNVYRTVYAAQAGARQRIRAGVPCEQIDAGAREVIETAGFGERFTHRTGHGIGMQVHESPYIVAGNQEPLRAGECFSIEPGIYLPGAFGVRLENIVSATETGHITFNKEPNPDLEEIGI